MRRTLILAVVMVLMAAVVNAQDYLRTGQLVVAGATAITASHQTIYRHDDTG
jgi:hypothetical protein